MSERRFDDELATRALVGFGVGLAAVTGLALVVVWLLVGTLQRRAVARDPAPSPLPAAAERRLPPEPRLQTAPEGDLLELRAEEERRLASYGWADRSQGLARIPIERAIEIVADRGLPARAPAEDEP